MKTFPGAFREHIRSNRAAYLVLVLSLLPTFGAFYSIQTIPAFHSEPLRYLSYVVLCAGLTLSCSLFGITASEARARSAAERLNETIRVSEENLLQAHEALQARLLEKERAEAALAYERDLLQTLLDNIPDRVYFKDRDSRFLKCSREVAKRFGLSNPAEAIGKTDSDFLTSEHAQAARQHEEQIMKTSEPLIGLVEMEHSQNGEATWVLTTKMPLKDKKGNIIGTFGISKDISAIKKSEDALAKETERLAVTLRSIGEGVITTDSHGSIVLMNRVAEEMTGCTQAAALGKALRDVFKVTDPKSNEPLPSPVARTLLTGQSSEFREPALLLAGSELSRHVAYNISPIRNVDGRVTGAVLVFRDVTERMRVEEELLKANKLESIGLLAGGIAHDFNNILTSIVGNLSLAKMSAHSMDKLLARIADAERAATRARALTHQLLTFAKGGEPIKKSLQLPAMLKTLPMALLRDGQVQCEWSLPEDLWTVEGDEGQVTQVLKNVITNAREAMNDAGKIEIRAENVQVGQDVLPPLTAGNYVRISVRDHGPGISPEHLNKIFQPYFTTKEQGTGLGLALAYSIIRKHDGLLKVESVIGVGSVFCVYLPASNKSAIHPGNLAPTQTQFFGRGRILVMDDEPEIRMVASMMLEMLGYEVELVRDGGEALDRYVRARAQGRPFDAVIMDLSIPNGMGGKETIRRLRELDPRVRAIVSSGYSYDPVMANFRDYGFSGVVPKPYELEDLGQALREMLGNGESTFA